MALGSTEPVTEMSTRTISGVNAGRSVKPISSPPSLSQLSSNSTSHSPKGFCLVNVRTSKSHKPMGM
jgi:hypothetical protein